MMTIRPIVLINVCTRTVSSCTKIGCHGSTTEPLVNAFVALDPDESLGRLECWSLHVVLYAAMEENKWTYVLSRLAPVAVALTFLSWGCTSVKENWPAGSCEPKTQKCVGNDLVKCSLAGVEYTVTCANSDPCHTGEDGEATCIPAVTTPTCVVDDDCLSALGDPGVCKSVGCVDGFCKIQDASDGTACDDGNACYKNTACLDGECFGQEIDCDDNNSCTQDRCLPISGCKHEPDDLATCTDGDPCTLSDACADGQCVPGVPVDCNDDNACTNDYCDSATGECVQEATLGDCDDGDSCTGDDTCKLGVCTGTPTCPCSTVSDCPSDGPDNACLGSYVCADNPNSPGKMCAIDPMTKVTCSQDGMSICQSSVCQPVDGKAECVTVAISNGTPCEDNDECTVKDQCQSGQCTGTMNYNVPGCANFHLRSWYVTPSAPTGDPSTHQFKATLGYPQITGTAENDLYRVRPNGLPMVGETE